MRQLLPFPADDVDPYTVYRPDDDVDRLVRINMVATVDGHVTDGEGRSGGLAGDGDRAVFMALRALADGILVGAGTARDEGYGPHRVSSALAERRRADGRTAPAAVVLVSRSLRIDVDAPLFTEARTPTMVVTSNSAPADDVARLRRAGPVIQAGDEQVDLATALDVLADEHGIRHVLCEGGPSLNAALWATGSVDELCLTRAPQLTGVDGPGIISLPAPAATFDIRSLCTQDGELYLRYEVNRDG